MSVFDTELFVTSTGHKNCLIISLIYMKKKPVYVYVLHNDNKTKNTVCLTNFRILLILN